MDENITNETNIQNTSDFTEAVQATEATVVQAAETIADTPSFAIGAPQANVSSSSANDVPQTNISSATATDIPQTNAGSAAATDVPQTNAGSVAATDIPQTNAGSAAAANMYQNYATGSPATGSPAVNTAQQATVAPNPYAQYGQPGTPYWNGTQAYGYIGYAPNGVPYIQQPPQPKEKKPSKVGKFFAGLGLSALFGLVAAAVFILSMWICKKYIFNTDTGLSTQTQELSSDSEKNNKLNLDPVSDKNQLISPTVVADSANLESTDVSKVVEDAMPSIVSIDCTFNTSTIWGTYQSAGAGSGIILKKTDKELLVATNSHVIDSAITIKVTFNNSKAFDATLKGKDALADLAVISIPIADLDDETLKSIKVATLGSSDDIKVGQMAIAIGNSLGYGQSVTVGYISAKDREVKVDSKTMILLQTDAAINPGNSGGALLNVNGEVIGINSVKYADSSVEGMGFAIPISRAFDILTDLSDREILTDEEKGYLGVYIEDVTADFAEAYNWPVGIYVADLVEGGAAEKAGILRGDIITGVNGITITTSDELSAKIQSIRHGQEVTITVSRLNSGAFEELDIKVVLQPKAETETTDDKDNTNDKNSSENKNSKDNDKNKNGENSGNDSDTNDIDPGNIIPDDRYPNNGNNSSYPFDYYDDFFEDPFSFFGW